MFNVEFNISFIISCIISMHEIMKLIN